MLSVALVLSLLVFCVRGSGSGEEDFSRVSGSSSESEAEFPTVPPPDGYDRCTTTFTSTTGGGEQMVASLYNLVAAQTLVVKTPILNETTGLYYEFYINPCFESSFSASCVGANEEGYLVVAETLNVTKARHCRVFSNYALPAGVTDKAKGVTYFSQLSSYVVHVGSTGGFLAQIVFSCNAKVSAATPTVNYDQDTSVVTIETPLVCPTPTSAVVERQVSISRSSGSTTASDRCYVDFIQAANVNYELDLNKTFGHGRTITTKTTSSDGEATTTVYVVSPCALVLFESCGNAVQSGYAGYTDPATGVCYVFHERRALWDPLTLTLKMIFSSATTTNGVALPAETELKVATRCGRNKNTESSASQEGGGGSGGYILFTTEDACPSIEEDDHHHDHGHQEEEDQSEVPTGAVVGIVIGAVVAILVGVAMFGWTRRTGSKEGQYDQV